MLSRNVNHQRANHLNAPGGGRPDADIKEGLEGTLFLVYFVYVVCAAVHLRLHHLLFCRLPGRGRVKASETRFLGHRYKVVQFILQRG